MVYELCQKTFLSLWSYANPLRKDGRELCDVLVVFGNDVIIFSVKQVGLGKAKQDPAYNDRWRRRAVENSARQIIGAEKQLKQLSDVIRADNTPGVKLPDPKDMRVHRIAVALGSEGQVSIPSGKYNGSFVHVLDEISVQVILGELDTISDFTAFLTYVEDLLAMSDSVTVMGGYEDLMGFYTLNERKLPDSEVSGADLFINSGFWEELKTRPEYRRKKTEDKVSYFWDSLIDMLKESLTYNIQGAPPTLDEFESIVRIMAKENRFNRRVLAQSFYEWHTGRLSRSRICVSLAQTVYVFLACPPEVNRDARRRELLARCYIARGKYKDSTTVVGIATEEYDPRGFSLDAALVETPVWSDTDEENMKRLVQEAQIFKETKQTRVSYQEYPEEPKPDDS